MPYINIDKVARIIIDAAQMGDKAAAEKWGIADRTVRRYWERLKHDPALHDMYCKLHKEHEIKWVKDIGKRPQKPTVRNLDWVVYVVSAGNGIYKIGRTNNLKSRLKALYYHSPIPLELIASFPCHPYGENALHQFFETKRDHGEWFNLDESDIRYIVSEEWRQLELVA